LGKETKREWVVYILEKFKTAAPPVPTKEALELPFEERD
jgi:hypothetical protein